MKSVHDMTAAEIKAARESGQTVYGTVMVRNSNVNRRELVYSDLEDFCPFTLRMLILNMKQRGWREVADNRYIKAGKHPEAACKSADANLARMAAEGPRAG